MAELRWPAARLADAIALLVSESKLSSARGPSASIPPLERAALNRWIEAMLQTQHVESVRGDVRYRDVDALLKTRVPRIVRLGDAFLLFLGNNRLIDADQHVRRIPREELRRMLCSAVEEGVANDIDGFLDRVGVHPRRREVAREAMLRAQLGHRVVATCWELRR